jgi:uncharacterized membrane protein
MTIAVWIVSGILAALYLFAGFSKVTQPREKLLKNFPYVETVGVTQTRVIGVLEILGAIGLIVPALTGILPVLTTIAAIGLVLVQVGAIIVHVIRKEASKSLPMNLGLLLAAAFVAVGRLLGF